MKWEVEVTWKGKKPTILRSTDFSFIACALLQPMYSMIDAEEIHIKKVQDEKSD